MWKPGLFEFLFSFRKLERNGNSNREPQQYFHSITISCQLSLNKVLIKLTFFCRNRLHGFWKGRELVHLWWFRPKDCLFQIFHLLRTTRSTFFPWPFKEQKTRMAYLKTTTIEIFKFFNIVSSNWDVNIQNLLSKYPDVLQTFE